MSETVEEVHPIRTIRVWTDQGELTYQAHAATVPADGGLEVLQYVRNSLFVLARFSAGGWLRYEAETPSQESVDALERYIRATARQQVRPVTPDDVLNEDDLPAAFRPLLK